MVTEKRRCGAPAGERRDSGPGNIESINLASIPITPTVSYVTSWDAQRRGQVFARLSGLTIGCHDVSKVSCTLKASFNTHALTTGKVIINILRTGGALNVSKGVREPVFCSQS